MTKEEALGIGSKIKNPIDASLEPLETIFVMIASYRDWQCPLTVESIFSRAKHPERVRVGIVDQMDTTLGFEHPCGKPQVDCKEHSDDIFCKYRHLIDTYEMEDELAVGPCFARHIGHRMVSSD